MPYRDTQSGCSNGGGLADPKLFKTVQERIDGLQQAIHDVTGDKCAP